MNGRKRCPIRLSEPGVPDATGLPNELWTDPTGELVDRLRRLGSDIGALRQELASLQKRQGWTATR